MAANNNKINGMNLAKTNLQFPGRNKRRLRSKESVSTPTCFKVYKIFASLGDKKRDKLLKRAKYIKQAYSNCDADY